MEERTLSLSLSLSLRVFSMGRRAWPEMKGPAPAEVTNAWTGIRQPGLHRQAGLFGLFGLFGPFKSFQLFKLLQAVRASLAYQAIPALQAIPTILARLRGIKECPSLATNAFFTNDSIVFSNNFTCRNCYMLSVFMM